MRILLQFPEGLKKEALKLAKKYEEEGHEVFVSASPCYGACDIALDEARWIKADKIVHFGHNKFVKHSLEIPVEYIPWRKRARVERFQKALPLLKPHKTITIITTVQYSHQIEEFKEFFENNGKKVVLGKGYWAIERGQVLGCDGLAAKEGEAVVYIGEGEFHPQAVEKPVICINPHTGEARLYNPEKMLKKRRAAMIKAYNAQTFGILLSTKVGQFNMAQALWAKKELEKRGKRAVLLVANEIMREQLDNFMEFECYINTACPRIVDDWERLGKPILNPSMLKEVLEWWDKAKDI